DVVVIGAPSSTVSGLTNAGKAYVFTKPGGGWSGVVFDSAQLFPSNPAAFSTFGWGVGIDGTTVVVTSNTKQGGAQEGEGYIFVRPGGGWAGSLTEDARLDPSSAPFLDAFGWSVGISVGTVAIGDTASSGNNDIGTVFVYE